MHHLPLYPTKPALLIETTEEADENPGCTACDLHVGVRNVCIGAEGEPGGLLVIGESPSRNDDALRRPFAGESGRMLRAVIAKSWKGPVAIDNVVRCWPNGKEVKDKHVEACLPYLADTIAKARPTRVITLGAWASYALTGRSVPPMSNRRAFTHMVSGRFGSTPVPVFFVIHPAMALRNRFVRTWFEADMRWALTTNQAPGAPLGSDVRVVMNQADAVTARTELSRAPWVAFDVETAGVIYDSSFQLLCISFCAAGSTSPWSWDAMALAHPGARAELIALLADAKIAKLGANVKFDEIACDLMLGVKPAGVRGDVRLWRKLLEPEAEGRLAKMAELVGMGGIKEEQQAEMGTLVKRVKKGQEVERRLAKYAAEDAALVAQGAAPKKRVKLQAAAAEGLAYLHELDRTMPNLAPVIRDPERDWESWAHALAPTEMLLRYNGRDSVATAALADWLRPQLEAIPELDAVRRNIIEPAALAVRAVERWGVPVDRASIVAFDAYLDVKLADVRKRLDAHGGPDFDANSPPQVSALLFGKLGLSSTAQTKTGKNSTAEGALDEIKDHPAVAAILDWRGFSKLKSTYASGMLKHVRPDGRIHTSLLLDGARSGRLSSADPNLQNIPRPDSFEGKLARDCFACRSEFTFLEFDYSQLELRIAALLSGDPEMIAIFKAGVDYHQRTAELISHIAWGIPPEAVTSKYRTMAKAVNFGILYGKTAKTLAAEWGVSIAKAETVVGAIMGRFKLLAKWCDDQRNTVRRTGVSWTWWDGQPARRRPLWRIADSDSKGASTADNGAVNTPIQGTASDFCLSSLTACVQWIQEEDLEEDVRLVLPVHDSLLFEVRKELLPAVRGTIREIMTGWNSKGVPLEVDEKIGPRWGSLLKAA